MFYITVDDEITLYLLQEYHYHTVYRLLETNRDHIQEHMTFPIEGIDEIRELCLNAQKRYAEHGDHFFHIYYKGQPAGMIGLWNRTGGTVSGIEVSYWLGKSFTGKGIVTRSLRTLTDFVFSELGANRMFLGITPNNPKSYAIPERLGFTLEGTLRQNDKINGHWVDHRIYAMLKDDWTVSQNPPRLAYLIADNLELRLIEKRHAQALFDLCDDNREHIGKWLTWIDDTKTVDDTMGFIERSIKQYGENNGFQAGIWQDNQLVGMIGYLYWNFVNRHTEIGYWLAKDATGQGIITKCTRALVDYAINILKLNRVIIRCSVGNEKSCNVAERLGFTHEGVERQGIKLRDHYTDVHVYSILAEEWQNNDL